MMLLLLNVNVISHSQEIFPLANAKWTGALVVVYQWPNDIKYTYFEYLIQGDTIVDNILRSKLYYIPDINKTDTILTGYFHVVGKIVYYRKVTDVQNGICDEFKSDYPLYDFSLQEGDIYSFCWAGESTSLKVTSVEQVEFGGSIRKKINFEGYPHCPNYWIEGMGGCNGFFEGYEGVPTADGWHYDYICFSVNNEILYMNPNYSECPTSGLNSLREIKADPLTVFSNRMKSTVTVQSVQPLKLIQIYKINGILLCERPCNGELSVVVPNQSLSSGIYFVKCILQNGNVETKKLIIQ